MTQSDKKFNCWPNFTKHYSRNITVRSCCDTDSFEKIAELIYHTDKYIYPAAFGNLDNAKKILPELLNEDHSVFSKKNIKVALDGDEIVGISVILSLSNYNEISQDIIDKYKHISPNLSNVCDRYFNKMSNICFQDTPYLMCLCVDENHRGKKIGGILLKNTLIQYKDRHVKLHVLKQYDPTKEVAINPAVTLYEKLGFSISLEELGFALNPEDAPECFEMIRKKHE